MNSYNKCDFRLKSYSKWTVSRMAGKFSVPKKVVFSVLALAVVVIIVESGYFTPPNSSDSIRMSSQSVTTKKDFASTEIQLVPTHDLLSLGTTKLAREQLVRSKTPPSTTKSAAAEHVQLGRYSVVTTKSSTEQVVHSSVGDKKSITPTKFLTHVVTYLHSITLLCRNIEESERHKINSSAVLQRADEELFVLRKNLNHPLVKSVHLLAENKTALDIFLRNKGLGSWSEKIHIYENGRQTRMKDVLQYISKELLNETVLYANGDIYLGRGFDRINVIKMREQKIMYALTRHPSPEGKCTQGVACNKPYVGSHDVFVMNLVEPIPEVVLNEIDCELGFPGIENRLMWAFKTFMNFCLLNPCSILETFHYHCSSFRSNRSRVNEGGKSAIAYPTTNLTCH